MEDKVESILEIKEFLNNLSKTDMRDHVLRYYYVRHINYLLKQLDEAEKPKTRFHICPKCKHNWLTPEKTIRRENNTCECGKYKAVEDSVCNVCFRERVFKEAKEGSCF